MFPRSFTAYSSFMVALHLHHMQSIMHGMHLQVVLVCIRLSQAQGAKVLGTHFHDTLSLLSGLPNRGWKLARSCSQTGV